MFCKECGKKIPDDSKYCSHCGTRQSILQDMGNQIEANPQIETPTQNVNITLSFKKPSLKTVEEKTKIEKVEKYDLTYKGDSEATSAGIAVTILFIIILTVARFDNEVDQQIFRAIFALVSLIWRIVATVWCSNIAKKQNRPATIWGIFAFLTPNLALIIIGLLKKLLKTSVDESASNLQESNVKSINTSSNELIIKDDNEDLIKYSIRNIDIIHHTFSKDQTEIRIEFSDNRSGSIYTFDSIFFFIIHTDNSQFYYRSKESAIKALYLYLKEKKTHTDNFAYSS